MAESSSITALLTEANIGAAHCQSIWMCSTLTLIRNLSKFHFPHKLDDDSRRQIMGLMGTQLIGYQGFVNPQIFKMEDTSSREKELLFEHFHATHPFVHAQAGEAFVVDQQARTLAAINVEDHLELTQIDCGDEPEKTFSDLVKMETSIGQGLDFAYSPIFGFLTANPSQSGTAFLVRAFLQVPGLILSQQLENIIEKHKNEFINISGLTGGEAAKEFVGNMAVISNAFTLNVNEEQILRDVRTFATHLLVEEKGFRARMQNAPRADIKDAIMRAYGLVKFSYQLDTFEALNAISLLKMALDMQWITGITHGKLNELFFNCRRAHLMTHMPENTSQEDLAHKRAEFIRNGLATLELKI